MARARELALLRARPRKRQAPAPLPDDPLVRARARYISSRVTLKTLAAEFKGLPGCSFGSLGKRAATEDWFDDREKYYEKTVAETVERLGLDDADRNARHLLTARNTITTLDAILSGIHTEVHAVIAARAADVLTTPAAVQLLNSLASAARNVATGQSLGIDLEQRLAGAEGSAFQKMAEAAEVEYQSVVDRRNELVKQAEDAARAEKAAADRPRKKSA